MKILIALISGLVIIFSASSIGLSNYTYIGPYYIKFNDSLHPTYILSTQPILVSYKHSDELHYLDRYIGIGQENNSSLVIVISEGALGDETLMNHTNIYSMKGFTRLQSVDRLIDGKDAVVSKFRNNTSDNFVLDAVFSFPIEINRWGYERNQYAMVEIGGQNYSDLEFDRVLDTFTIYRLVK